MGYTSFTKQLVEKYIAISNPRYVIDLGAQNDFSGPHLPAPFISEWFNSKGIGYSCIDLNGENGAIVADLSERGGGTNQLGAVKLAWLQYEPDTDMVLDIGTSEHVGDNGKFGWDAIYNCWVNKWKLLKVGGILISENPISKSWPGHGFNYYTLEFYNELIPFLDGILLECDIHAACGNTTDGWNVWSVIRKTGERFPSLEEFQTLSLKQS